jgi:hypothetical protein
VAPAPLESAIWLTFDCRPRRLSIAGKTYASAFYRAVAHFT